MACRRDGTEASIWLLSVTKDTTAWHILIGKLTDSETLEKSQTYMNDGVYFSSPLDCRVSRMDTILVAA
jgi:hypothetical protein